VRPLPFGLSHLTPHAARASPLHLAGRRRLRVSGPAAVSAEPRITPPLTQPRDRPTLRHTATWCAELTAARGSANYRVQIEVKSCAPKAAVAAAHEVPHVPAVKSFDELYAEGAHAQRRRACPSARLTPAQRSCSASGPAARDPRRTRRPNATSAPSPPRRRARAPTRARKRPRGTASANSATGTASKRRAPTAKTRGRAPRARARTRSARGPRTLASSALPAAAPPQLRFRAQVARCPRCTSGGWEPAAGTPSPRCGCRS
jgi:hypothetical protein